MKKAIILLALLIVALGAGMAAAPAPALADHCVEYPPNPCIDIVNLPELDREEETLQITPLLLSMHLPMDGLTVMSADVLVPLGMKGMGMDMGMDNRAFVIPGCMTMMGTEACTIDM